MATRRISPRPSTPESGDGPLYFSDHTTTHAVGSLLRKTGRKPQQQAPATTKPPEEKPADLVQEQSKPK